MGRNLYGGSILETWENRIGELEAEVARLKGEQKPLKDFLREVCRKAAECKFPKKCGCGASVRDVPTHEFPWNCNPGGCLTQPMKDGWHCIVCGEELKP